MVPVFLITGFLGSGKTTFLNWILSKYPDKKVSVILNEFGNIKLESQFIKTHKEDIVELANGCMCCVAKSDVPRVIDYILENSPDTEYLFIEASGLSDPDPIHESFTDPRISSKVYLNKILCIVDAVNFLDMKETHRAIMAQLADSDIALLSKTSEAGSEKTKQVESSIKTMMPMTLVLKFNELLDPTLILSKNSHVEDSASDHEHHHVHDDVSQWWYKSEKSFTDKEMSDKLSDLPSGIIRAKGYFIDNEGNKMLIQYVNGKFEFLLGVWEVDDKKETAILFISAKDNFDDIQKSFK